MSFLVRRAFKVVWECPIAIETEAAHAHVNISGAPAICDSRSSDLSLEAVVLQEKALAKQLRLSCVVTPLLLSVEAK